MLLTAIIAARRLASCSEIGQIGKACARAIIDRYCERAPVRIRTERADQSQ